jgi:hypothetical protein
MTPVGQPECATQNRVIALFRDELGYRYLGDWTDRDANSNIEDGLLSAWLTRRGYTAPQTSVALHRLRTEADNHSRTLVGTMSGADATCCGSRNGMLLLSLSCGPAICCWVCGHTRMRCHGGRWLRSGIERW